MIQATLLKELDPDLYSSLTLLIKKLPYLKEVLDKELLQLTTDLLRLDPHDDNFKEEYMTLQAKREVIQDFLNFYKPVPTSSVEIIKTF